MHNASRPRVGPERSDGEQRRGRRTAERTQHRGVLRDEKRRIELCSHHVNAEHATLLKPQAKE
jgi:hypothetical protein